jgi:hypothetical protein
MSISGPSPEKPTYQSDFKESLNVFQKSFEGYKNSTFDVQKDQYSLAMKESMNAMQDSINGLMNAKLQKLKSNLEGHVDEYMENPNLKNEQKVEGDLKNIKDES